MHASKKKTQDAPAPFVVSVLDDLTETVNDYEFSSRANAISFAVEECAVETQRVLVLERKFVRGKWQEFCVDLGLVQEEEA